jgi:hypothetical protein
MGEEMATRPTKTARTRAERAQDPAGPAESPEPRPAEARPAAPRPRALGVAAAAQAIEAAGVGVAAVFAAVSTADGRSYELASGVALTLIAIGTAALFAVFAVGLARAKPWSRTPVVMTQLFVIIAGITLLNGNRPEWGGPALLLAACCLGGLFTPASLRALNRPPR